MVFGFNLLIFFFKSDLFETKKKFLEKLLFLKRSRFHLPEVAII